MYLFYPFCKQYKRYTGRTDKLNAHHLRRLASTYANAVFMFTFIFT